MSDRRSAGDRLTRSRSLQDGPVSLWRSTVAALAAQGVSSLGNVVIGLLVARFLGPVEFGRFAILFAILQVCVALQTHGVGDSLTVLDRSLPGIRSAIHLTQYVHGLLGFVVGSLSAIMLVGLSWSSSTIFGLLIVFWEFEEYARRALMANLQFIRQGISDVIYLLVVVIGLGVAQGFFELTLNAVVLAMGIGAAVAGLLGQLLLRKEDRLRGVEWCAARQSWGQVFEYGGWRSLSAVIGSLSQLGLRVVVAQLASLYVLGNVEAARILVAPLFTATAALGNILLPLFARERRLQHGKTSGSVHWIGVLGVVCVVLYGSACLTWTGFLMNALAGPQYVSSRLLVCGWVLAALVFAALNNSGVRALVVLSGRVVFTYRGLGALAILGGSWLVCLAGLPYLVPYCVAIGSAIGGVGLLVAVGRDGTKPDASGMK